MSPLRRIHATTIPRPCSRTAYQDSSLVAIYRTHVKAGGVVGQAATTFTRGGFLALLFAGGDCPTHGRSHLAGVSEGGFVVTRYAAFSSCRKSGSEFFTAGGCLRHGRSHSAGVSECEFHCYAHGHVHGGDYSLQQHAAMFRKCARRSRMRGAKREKRGGATTKTHFPPIPLGLTLNVTPLYMSFRASHGFRIVQGFLILSFLLKRTRFFFRGFALGVPGEDILRGRLTPKRLRSLIWYVEFCLNCACELYNSFTALKSIPCRPRNPHV